MSEFTSGVREVLPSFPTVGASPRAFLVFVQAGFAVDPPTTCHLVWGTGYKKADLTRQLVWWCLHKLAVIPASIGSIGSHLLEKGQTTSTCGSMQETRYNKVHDAADFNNDGNHLLHLQRGRKFMMSRENIINYLASVCMSPSSWFLLASYMDCAEHMEAMVVIDNPVSAKLWSIISENHSYHAMMSGTLPNSLKYLESTSPTRLC